VDRSGPIWPPDERLGDPDGEPDADEAVFIPRSRAEDRPQRTVMITPSTPPSRPVAPARPNTLTEAASGIYAPFAPTPAAEPMRPESMRAEPMRAEPTTAEPMTAQPVPPAEFDPLGPWAPPERTRPPAIWDSPFPAADGPGEVRSPETWADDAADRPTDYGSIVLDRASRPAAYQSTRWDGSASSGENDSATPDEDASSDEGAGDALDDGPREVSRDSGRDGVRRHAVEDPLDDPAAVDSIIEELAFAVTDGEDAGSAIDAGDAEPVGTRAGEDELLLRPDDWVRDVGGGLSAPPAVPSAPSPWEQPPRARREPEPTAARTRTAPGVYALTAAPVHRLTVVGRNSNAGRAVARLLSVTLLHPEPDAWVRAAGTIQADAQAFETGERLTHEHGLAVVDAGSDVRTRAWWDALEGTDRLIVAVNGAGTGPAEALAMLDAFERSAYADLARDAVTVILLPVSRFGLTRGHEDVGTIRQSFEERTAMVCIAPFDIRPTSTTRTAWQKIGAAVRAGIGAPTV
jgi:hypothetical protein